MSEQYYDLEKAATILKLSPAEVNRLREKGEIQGFRDGSSWKFKRDVIDNYYVAMKQKKSFSPFGTSDQAEENLLSSEDDQDLPTMMADSASFAQFGDGILSGSASMAGHDVSEANLDDGLMLINDEHIDDLILSDDSIKPKHEQPIEIFGIQGENGGSGSGLNLGSDSGLSLVGGSGVDLAGSDKIFDDDDVVIGGSSSGLNLGGDSGISLLDAAADSGFSLAAGAGGSDAILELAADDDILALAETDILALTDSAVDPDTATILGTEAEDFQLQADDDLFLSDDSESSSQVIAIEGDLDGFEFAEVTNAPTGSNADDLLFAGDAPVNGGGINFMEVESATDGSFGGLGDMGGGFGSDDDTGGGFGATLSESTVTVSSPVSTPGSLVPQFTGLSVTVLFILVLVMAVGTTLMFELLRCMWSWTEPFTINSSILDLFGK